MVGKGETLVRNVADSGKMLRTIMSQGRSVCAAPEAEHLKMGHVSIMQFRARKSPQPVPRLPVNVVHIPEILPTTSLRFSDISLNLPVIAPMHCLPLEPAGAVMVCLLPQRRFR